MSDLTYSHYRQSPCKKLIVDKVIITENSLLNKHCIGFDSESAVHVSIKKSDVSCKEWFQSLSTECQTDFTDVIMTKVLDGFIHNSPKKILWMMTIRNFLVRPLQLRKSSLGCPISSLLDTNNKTLFRKNHPVLAYDNLHCENKYGTQVLLGADDKHLTFRSCVTVMVDNDEISISLATRVKTKNLFGKFYMFMIHIPHTHYIEPALLTHAVEYLLNTDDM